MHLFALRYVSNVLQLGLYVLFKNDAADLPCLDIPCARPARHTTGLMPHTPYGSPTASLTCCLADAKSGLQVFCAAAATGQPQRQRVQRGSSRPQPLPASMADPESVGKAFLQYYYQLFESNRAGLANLYQDASMLTFEGQKFQGPQAIVGKLSQLPFNQCKINADTMDFQPSVSGGVMVFVTGKIIVSGWQECQSSSMFRAL